MQAVSNQTYIFFAKKHKIPLSKVIDGNREKKTIPQLKGEIKSFEKKNKVTDGLYY